MTFAYPWMLLLLLAVPVIAWLKGRRKQQAAFLYSSIQLVRGLVGFKRSAAGMILPKLRWLALIALIIGLARPQMFEGETIVKASGIDIVVAVDLSKSMAAEDFEVQGRRVNRLEIAKGVLEQFIAKRPVDRIGLVAFAGRAYIASPMTLDHDFLLQNLERLNMNTIEDGTAIGSGLSASLNRLRDLKSKSKIVILMTDGQNNSGKIPPLTAAEAAETLGIKVYTIGVGTRGMAPMPYVDVFGQRRDQLVQVNIDEETLTGIADKTGGRYFRADNTDTLIGIYDEIDQLEKTDIEMKKYLEYTELFPWFVLPGLTLLLLEILLAHTIWRRLP
jgi:Ca-activated chloride channel family protein